MEYIGDSDFRTIVIIYMSVNFTDNYNWQGVNQPAIILLFSFCYLLPVLIFLAALKVGFLSIDKFNSLIFYLKTS